MYFAVKIICSYQECNDIIDAYSRAIVKYNLLAVTDGTQKRTDGTPVVCYLIR